MSYNAPPPPPPPPDSPYGQMPGYGAVPASNQKALWSMILGIVGLVCCGVVFGIAAIVLSKQAQREIAGSGGSQGGGGQAQAGFILGVIDVALWAVVIVGYLIVTAARV